MGDTLTHLDEPDSVRSVLRDMARILEPGGRCILSFRDYSPPLTGTERFIPVRSDDTTIFTCFLEYEGPYVHVHDLVYRNRDGMWEFSTSCYRKLPMAAEWVVQQLQEAGLHVEEHSQERGVVTIIARRIIQD